MTPYRQRIFDIICTASDPVEEHDLAKIVYGERWEQEYRRHGAWVRAVGQACHALIMTGVVKVFHDRNGYPHYFKVEA